MTSSNKEFIMSAKNITSLQANVRKSMEDLYDSCRRGKISDIPKLHKKFSKAKDELDSEIKARSKNNGKEK